MRPKDDISENINHRSSLTNTIGRRQYIDQIIGSSEKVDELLDRPVWLEVTEAVDTKPSLPFLIY